MTKQDYLDELKEAISDVSAERENDDPFYRGQAVAFSYAYELARRIKPYSTRKTAKTLEIRLTDEQARHLEGLLGNGALDRLLRAKITRARSARDDY